MTKPVRKIMKIRFLLLIYAGLIPVMFILPFYSFEGYSILRHTTSHLGAQTAPNAWIMNLVFFLLGAACILESWILLRRFRINRILLYVFGLGLMGVAIFKHAPVVEGLAYSAFEDSMHSFFATLVGFSYTLFALSATLIERANKRRAAALLAGIMAIVFTVLIFGIQELAGLWQRIMFIALFGWLIFFFEGLRARR